MIKVYLGDALEVLKKLDSESVDCVMTSPPYWALRAYQTEPQIWDGDENCEHEWSKEINAAGNHKYGAGKTTTVGNNVNQDLWKGSSKTNFCSKCGAWKGELGLEPTFDLYIKHLCNIFDEVKRVLKKTGTCWINIGDTYSASIRGSGGTKKAKVGASKEGGGQHFNSFKTKQQLSPKSLIMIPFRFAIGMVNRGWILRNTIIWKKPNAMPSSAKDRFTVDFEYLFFFSKSKKYYFNQQFEQFESNKYDKARMAKARTEYGGKWAQESGGAIKTQRAFVAGHSKGRNKRCVWSINTKPYPEAHYAVYPEEFCETPLKAGCPKDGVVLDPFTGSGTTLKVAREQGKNAIGIELNPKDLKRIKKRIYGSEDNVPDEEFEVIE